MIKKIYFLPLFLAAFSVCASAQNSSLTSSSIDSDTIASSGRTSVTEMMDVADVEPLSKRFRMNVPFVRASYSRVEQETASVGHQYIWDKFNEGFIMLQYFEYPSGTIPRPAAAQKEWARNRTLSSFVKGKVQTLSEKEIKVGDVAGEEYEVIFQGRPATIRTFAANDVFYALTALPVAEHAGPIIEKLFDSFEFVKP